MPFLYIPQHCILASSHRQPCLLAKSGSVSWMIIFQFFHVLVKHYMITLHAFSQTYLTLQK